MGLCLLLNEYSRLQAVHEGVTETPDIKALLANSFEIESLDFGDGNISSHYLQPISNI